LTPAPLPRDAAPLQPARRAPRAVPWLVGWGMAALLAFAGFLSLGIWQVERRAWKLDLIARVDARVHAPPVAAPGPERWPAIGGADEYRHVRLAGRFLHEREALVQAVTELGSGFWVLTPLQQSDGSTVLVNRGFVPAALRERATRAAGEPAGAVDITGLVRLTEPGGGFLRRNDPAADRWFSRDVGAIAAARALERAAPYFVDADAAAPAVAGQPQGGMTVIRFPNNHLVYALTWFALAAGVAAAALWVLREEWQLRRGDPLLP